MAYRNVSVHSDYDWELTSSIYFFQRVTGFLVFFFFFDLGTWQRWMDRLVLASTCYLGFFIFSYVFLLCFETG